MPSIGIENQTFGSSGIRPFSVFFRVRKAGKKYGWRAPILAVARLAESVSRLRNTMRRLRIMLLCRAVVGPGTVIEDGCYFSPGGMLEIGKQVHIGRNSSYYLWERPDAAPQPVRIGDRTWISEGFLLASLSGVQIGRDVLIGEYVSIRDSTHRYAEKDVPIREQGDRYGTVVIGDNVWIGRGCLIQGRPEGTVIGEGSVIAANSVVTHSILPMQVWGGVPARFIKSR